MQKFTKWHDWEVTEFLGKGSYGEVYQIERTAYGHTYKSALKVISIPSDPQEYDNILSTGMSEEDAKEYFHGMAEAISREFALMSEFRGNSNIVSFEDFEVIPGDDGYSAVIYIRMELLEPLLRYMKNNAMTSDDVIDLACDILKALELCEQRNIIHRDIKPENIFRSDQGAFKLGDFGIARELENSTTGMSKKGTVSYMAPEVYGGRKYGSNVDIYSLGIMLYRLMNNNRLPFLPPYPEKIRYADTEKANLRRITGEELPLPCNAQDELGEIILKACRFDPKDRYQHASEMRRALENYKAGKTGFIPDSSFDDDYADEGTVSYPESGFTSVSAEPEYSSVYVPAAEEEPAKNAAFVLPADETASKDAGSPVSPGAEIRPEQKEEKKTKPDKPGKGKLIGILAAAAVAVLVLVIAVGALGNTGKVEIAGYEYQKDTTFVLLMDEEELTVDDFRKMDQLPKLEEIEITGCTLDNDMIQAMGDLKVGVTKLIMHNCNGFDDVTPLTNMKFLVFLNMSNCGVNDDMLAAADFGKMENLAALRLQNNPDITTLDSIASAIPKLQGLSISKTSISDISRLSEAGELRMFLAADCGITDISPLKCSKMMYINLERNNISDISIMKNMQGLLVLKIADNNISDLSPLAALPDLDTLSINGNHVKDLAPVAKCPKLKTLQACGNGLESLESLSGHSSLIDLYVNNNKLTSLKGIENELELICLSASDNELTDMSGAENFTQLEDVNLEGNKIEDIQVLKKSTESLKWVDISGNPVGSLDTFSGTQHLKGIYCDNTGISSLEPVRNNTELEEVSAQNNELSSADVLAGKPALKAVDLSGNKISDMSPFTQAKYDNGGYLYLDLQDNEIAAISFPEGESWLSSEMAVAGNPVRNASVTTSQQTEEIGCDFLGITYYDGMEGQEWIQSLKAGTHLNITDCPLDKQVPLKTALSGIVLEDYINYTGKDETEKYIAEKLYSVKRNNGTVVINEKYGENANITDEDENRELQAMEGQL